ncbi:hypothetical protein [Jannaschia sp. R86511]|uniref:hypothetical protein n=1 Tax=Jannaschia sp. R86511 TaxID=3093853 RepID=UPI0036D416AC
MATAVLLEPGCCPAGAAAVAVERAGGKAVRVRPATGGSPLREDGTPDAGGWAWRVADVVGISREALLAGCPVPLADAVTTWARAAEEVDAGRWDAVVVPVGSGAAVALLEAPGVVLRVLDARLDATAGAVGDDRVAAAQVAAWVQLRPGFAALADLAGSVGTWGTRARHGAHGCAGAAGLGLPTLDALGGPAEPTQGVRTGDGRLVWWLELPAGAEPELHQEEDRLVVVTGGSRRTFRLPAALRRCHVRGAAVVDHGPRQLEVVFEPDPQAWR